MNTRRLVQLIVGLALFGLGSGLMVQSDLGNPPWDVFHEGLALSSPLSIGVAAIITSFGVLLLWIPLRERPGLGTLANAVLIGVFIDLTVLGVETPEGLWLRVALMIGGVLLVGIGSGLYIGVRLGPGPRDGLMTGLARRGHSLRLARTGVEASALGVGWVLGGTVGVGTLAFALGIGPLVQVFLPRFDIDADSPGPQPERYDRAMTDLIERIRDSIIGADTAVQTPFGLRRVIYADYTASGRSLRMIEDFITDHVLPMYANTHTETSGTGLQTTRFREDARSIIKECVGAGDEHAVIFAGSGSTGAIDRLINILGIRIPADLEDRYSLSSHIPLEERPVVFVGPYEHHSNELPWRESIAEVIEIKEDTDGYIDLADLDRQLHAYEDRPLIIGSFSAASNVTGIVSNTTAVSSILHRHGALSFWDFAAAAPYVDIEMRSQSTHGDDYKDAIFISPHKFIGGPGTPGVLVVRRDLVKNRVPSVPGGGTVAYVNPVEHRYLSDAEHREEGGTPAIVESIRAGVVFRLKQSVGTETIKRIESRLTRTAIERLSQHPNIEILGNPDAHRLSILSFVVSSHGRYLHHNYVVALLNDLFGIQARGGCSCAGPYGHRLLGIDAERSIRFDHEIAAGCEVIKPGWARVNFNYFITDAEFEFILEAIEIIASDGWRLLSEYEFDTATGGWRHRDGIPRPPMTLHDLSFEDESRSFEDRRETEPLDRLETHLAEARRILADAHPSGDDRRELDGTAEPLRWFLLPADLVLA